MFREKLTLIAHADWSITASKRMVAIATIQNNGRYLANAPEPVGEPGTLLKRLVTKTIPVSSLLVGFDFPIGLPSSYARRAEIADFISTLPQFGQQRWADFFRVAERPDQICLQRPFYPYRPGGAKRQHLLDGLLIKEFDDLRRRCERAYPGRRAASPLFWTLGGQQVGKAAISGWQTVLSQGLQDESLQVVIWPFSGSLENLCRPGHVVVVETYPAEFYKRLNISFSRNRSGYRSGKRSQADRAVNGVTLLACADSLNVDLAPTLKSSILDGFGTSPDGEDTFDATIGLLGMIHTISHSPEEHEPKEEKINNIEGWIFGQAIGEPS